MQEDNFSEIWSDDDSDDKDISDGRTVSWQFRAVLIFILMWQFSFGVSSAGIIALLVFMRKLFQTLASNIKENSLLTELCNFLPKTWDAALKLIGITANNFTQYIVCPSCDAVFDYDSCYSKVGNDEISKKCPHIEFPNHPHLAQRKPCGTDLMLTVKNNTAFKKVKPAKLYPYQSLKVAITNLVNKHGFLEQCEHWRHSYDNLSTPHEHMRDIYDGRIWKHFQVYEGVSFLDLPYNFCFTLNVDWFQPFSHTRKLHT